MEERGTFDVEVSSALHHPCEYEFSTMPQTKYRPQNRRLELAGLTWSWFEACISACGFQTCTCRHIIQLYCWCATAGFPPRCPKAQHLRTGPEQQPEICPSCQIGSTPENLRILHRILPRFQSPSKYPASGFEERLTGNFSSLHCMFSYATHCNQQS
jgi:hypothetical protein